MIVFRTVFMVDCDRHRARIEWLAIPPEVDPVAARLGHVHTERGTRLAVLLIIPVTVRLPEVLGSHGSRLGHWVPISYQRGVIHNDFHAGGATACLSFAASASCVSFLTHIAGSIRVGVFLLRVVGVRAVVF